jgi:hypothetical protein
MAMDQYRSLGLQHPPQVNMGTPNMSSAQNYGTPSLD